jgi:hypothetical protein
MVVAAAVMVMPRSRSCGIQSICACTVVHLAQLVDAAGVEQEPLADGGLAGVDVRDHPDVSGAGELGCLATRASAGADMRTAQV